MRAAIQQSLHGVGVGLRKLVERHIAVAGVVHVGGNGERFVRGTNAARDEAGLFRVALRVIIRELSRKPRRLPVDLVHMVLEPELQEPIASRRERIGGKDVGARVQVLRLRVPNEVRLGEYQDVHAAPEVEFVFRKPVAPEVPLAQAVGLEHNTPRAVHDHDATLENPLDLGGPVGDGPGGERGRCCHRRFVLCSDGQTIVPKSIRYFHTRARSSGSAPDSKNRFSKIVAKPLDKNSGSVLNCS